MNPVTLEHLQKNQPQSLNVDDHLCHLVSAALLEARSNRTKAAELLGVSRRTFHRWLVKWPEFREFRGF